MSKVRVAVLGSVGKSILIDDSLSPRVAALERALAELGAARSSQHSTLQGLQVGNDHPQYPLKKARETISGQWNFTTEPEIGGDLLTEFIQDKIGTILVDSTSIDFTYSDATPSITASVITANPSGLIGMAAVNGTAATPLRSDGRHAIDPAIAPTWTGQHKNTYIGGPSYVVGTANGNANNTVGSPAHMLELVSDAGTRGHIRLASYGAVGSQNTIHLFRMQGTEAAPSKTLNGDIVMSIGLRGYGTSSVTGSVTAIIATAKEDWTDPAASTDLDFQLSPLAGVAGRASVFYLTGSDLTSKFRHKFTQIGSAGTPSLSVESTLPLVQLWDTDASVDEGKIQVFQAGNLFVMRKNNDANTDNRRFLEVQGAAAAVSAMLYGNATDLPPHTFNGQVRTTAGTTAAASLRIPHGAAPTAPVNGDIWTTTVGLFVRINGATVGPLT